MPNLTELLDSVCQNTGNQGRTIIPVASNGFDLMLGLAAGGNYAYSIEYHDGETEADRYDAADIQRFAEELIGDLQDAFDPEDYPTGDADFDDAWADATRDDDGSWSEEAISEWLISELEQLV